MGWISPKNTIFTFKRKTFDYSTKGQLESFEGTGTGFVVTPIDVEETVGDAEETDGDVGETAGGPEAETNVSGFMFIRAADMCEGLNAWDIIPCVDVKISDPVSTQVQHQAITFKASVHQRESGWYHLVGWSRPEESGGAWVNQACVYEFALKIRSRDPDHPDNQPE